jgi:hypothetical protein
MRNGKSVYIISFEQNGKPTHVSTLYGNADDVLFWIECYSDRFANFTEHYFYKDDAGLLSVECDIRC